MRKVLTIFLISTLCLALAIVGVRVLYRVFVTDKIMDPGDTVYHGPAVLTPDEDAELVEVVCIRAGDMEPENDFSYTLLAEDEQPLLSCSAWKDGSPLELEDVPVDPARVRELEKSLRTMTPFQESDPQEDEIEIMDAGRTDVYLKWSDGTEGHPAVCWGLVYDFFRDLVPAINGKEN